MNDHETYTVEALYGGMAPRTVARVAYRVAINAASRWRLTSDQIVTITRDSDGHVVWSNGIKTPWVAAPARIVASGGTP